MIRRKIIALILFFFSAAHFFCQENPEIQENSGVQGNPEKVLSLRQIDKFINDKNDRDFQKALLELNRYLSANPEQFDAVQRRYKKILGSRDHYVELADELMRLIRDSSEEESEKIDEQMMRITDRILALERNPGDERLEIVKDTNYLVSIRQYSAIQNKTAALVAERQYVQAGKKAAEGFGILHENFDAKYGGTEISEKAGSAINAINADLEQYRQLQEHLIQTVNLYVNHVGQENLAGAAAALNILKTVYSDYAKIRNDIVDNGLVIAECSGQIGKLVSRSNKSSVQTDDDKFLKHGDEYLPLAVGTVFGWKDNPHPDHGIIGVLDAQWNSTLEEMKKVSAEKMNAFAVRFSDTSSISAFRQTGALPDKAELEKIQALEKCAVAVNGLNSLLKNTNGKGFREPWQNYDISVEYLKDIAVHISENVDNVVKIAGIKSKGDQIQTPLAESAGQQELAGSNYVENLLAVASEIEATVRAINSNTTSTSVWGNTYRNLLEKQNGRIETAGDEPKTRTTSGVQIEDRILVWDKIETISNEYITASEEYADSSVSELYVRVAEYYAGCGVDFVKKAGEDNAAALADISGIAEAGVSHKFPKKAVDKLNDLNSYIRKARSVLSGSRQKLENKYESHYEAQTASINQSISDLDEIVKSNRGALDSANELIKLYDRNISEAEKAMAQAQKFFRQKKYDEARDSVNNSLDFYREALKSNYDSNLSASSEQNVIALLAQIAEQQKILVESEVNDLVAAANREYQNDNYTKAQNSLNKALERWNVIYPDYENYEITNLKAIIENALSANSGREVLPSDSLYLDVSQMLRSASQSFEKGQSLSRKGKAEESEAEFANALSTLEILRSLVPRNQVANILRLKIQQFQDPVQFEANFADRVASAKQDAKDKSKMVQAYSDLCDLQKIKPDYPGLEKSIIELEYALGKRVRPIDNTARKEAAALTNQARSLYNAGKYSQAFAKINQAIGKDSSNADARALRSQINRKMSATVSVRSPDLEDRYQEALEYSNASEFAKANDIVAELWKNPANRIEKLEKLKTRIERWM